MNVNYDHITISGGVGVGTTTLLNNLKPHLEPAGWYFTSTGTMFREMTKETVLPVASLAKDDIHQGIEKRAHDLLSKPDEHWVVDAWLAGFVAREMPKVLRVLLICSEPSIIVDRIVNRDKVSVGQAKEFVRTRFEDNMKTWKRIYGDHDFFDPKYYTLVVDTYSSGQLETVGRVLDKLGYKNGQAR